MRSRVWVPFVLSISLAACGDGPTKPGPVVPPEPLTITCPGSISVDSLSNQPVSVAYTPATSTGGRAPVTVGCSPAPNTQFSLGTTNVVCQAQDSALVTAACSFSVVVNATPRLSLTKFMAFGDSLTAGVKVPHLLRPAFAEPGAYPGRLQELLSARYRAQTIVVINQGVPGEEAVDGEARLGAALRADQPEALLLMEGTNDLTHYMEEAQHTAILDLDRMVRTANDAGVRVFLATIPPQPLGGRRDEVARLIPSFNNAIRDIASRRGAVLVDIEAVILADMSLIGGDEVHLTDLGYQAVAEKFMAVIRETLELPLGLQRHR